MNVQAETVVNYVINRKRLNSCSLFSIQAGQKVKWKSKYTEELDHQRINIMLIMHSSINVGYTLDKKFIYSQIRI